MYVLGEEQELLLIKLACLSTCGEDCPTLLQTSNMRGICCTAAFCLDLWPAGWALPPPALAKLSTGHVFHNISTEVPECWSPLGNRLLPPPPRSVNRKTLFVPRRSSSSSDLEAIWQIRAQQFQLLWCGDSVPRPGYLVCIDSTHYQFCAFILLGREFWASVKDINFNGK